MSRHYARLRGRYLLRRPNYAQVIKREYVGSRPTALTENIMREWLRQIGTVTGFKIQAYEGSTPFSRTNIFYRRVPLMGYLTVYEVAAGLIPVYVPLIIPRKAHRCAYRIESVKLCSSSVGRADACYASCRRFETYLQSLALLYD